MRILHILACGLGTELGGGAGKGREGAALLFGRCLRKFPADPWIWGKGGGEKQLVFAWLFQFFTPAWVRSVGWIGDGARGCIVVSILHTVWQR